MVIHNSLQGIALKGAGEHSNPYPKKRSKGRKQHKFLNKIENR